MSLKSFYDKFGFYSSEIMADSGYGSEQDFYVCPIGQHMEHITDKKTVSDLGYISNTSVYIAANCSKCPLRGLMHRSNKPIEPEPALET